jgi:hypothetical protein
MDPKANSADGLVQRGHFLATFDDAAPGGRLLEY